MNAGKKKEVDLPPPWRLAVERFRDWLHVKSLSLYVRKDYPRFALALLAHLFEEYRLADLRDITLAHLQGYHAWLLDRSLTPRTRNNHITALKSFFGFLYRTSALHQDPSLYLERPRCGARLPKGVLEVREVVTLLVAPDLTTPVGLRDRAILELLYSSGLRRSELCGLSLPDLNLQGRTVHIVGKGGVEAYVPFGQEAGRALKNYLAFGRPVLLKSRRGGPALSLRRQREEKGREALFLSCNGVGLPVGNLWNILKGYAEKAGLEGVAPHGLRHTCATHLLKNGADIRHIQALLRHKNLSTTQIYTRVAIEDLKAAQAKYHPRERHGEDGEEDEDG